MDRHTWRWASTNPGMMMQSAASTTSAFQARNDGPTSLMTPSSMSTSAPTVLPTPRSSERTVPPLMSNLPLIVSIRPPRCGRQPQRTFRSASTQDVAGRRMPAILLGHWPTPFPRGPSRPWRCSATECTLRTHTWANSCTRFVQSDTTEGRGGGPVSQPTAPPLGRRIRASAHVVG